MNWMIDMLHGLHIFVLYPMAMAMAMAMNFDAVDETPGAF